MKKHIKKEYTVALGMICPRCAKTIRKVAHMGRVVYRKRKFGWSLGCSKAPNCNFIG